MMSCKYCRDSNSLLYRDFVDNSSFGWYTQPVDPETITNSTYTVIIDRGFLRLVDKDDCQCIDNGERIEINFCPMCGVRL